MIRRRFAISGIVQGVGFRPFVFRLASDLALSGQVRNTPAGVEIEVQGAPATVERFAQRLTTELPPLAVVTRCEQRELPTVTNATGFEILPSSGGMPEVQIAPDTALCADCLRELFDPADRRFRHPFITCTNCGPRWTIISAIPYDRPLTTMAAFPLCPACEAEYRDPLNRRFHAQPIACPACGPRLSLVPDHPTPLAHAAALLRQGLIVAVKGLGGFHLAVDACNDGAVARLRSRKQRDEKPFAVMVPDLATARLVARLSDMEERLLAGPEAPVVIVRRRPDTPLSPLVAPGSRWVGLLLAYTPVHHLLFSDLATTLPALVMTSANRSDEPMIAGDREVRDKLADIADALLTHDRPIQVRTDDSVLRVFRGAPIFYRRSRGFVPRPVRLPFSAPPVLAFGAELKNTVCLTRRADAFMSQHIGDMKNEATFEACRETMEHLCRMLEVRPALLACDLHPDYLSTRLAEDEALRLEDEASAGSGSRAQARPIVRVQHHHAHMASCMAENSLDGEVTGVIFDGTGLGYDGTVWGGEFLVGGYGGVRRAGHLRQARLPGGDAAAREPWRMALSWLFESYGSACFERELPLLRQIPAAELPTLRLMLERGLNAPYTSSIGRLFDAVAALLGFGSINRFDGQAAMALEAAAENAAETQPLPCPLTLGASGAFLVDPTPAIRALTDVLAGDAGRDRLALAFHRGLAEAVAAGCRRIRADGGPERVVLSGGVFQNRLLTELVYTALAASGFLVFTHRLAPPNDGGIALGQAAIAAYGTKRHL